MSSAAAESLTPPEPSLGNPPIAALGHTEASTSSLGPNAVRVLRQTSPHSVSAPLSGTLPSSVRGEHHAPSGINVLDSVGATLSFACAVHCIALPFIVTGLPLLGLGFVAGSTFELIMISLTLTLATASFCWGVRLHGQWKTFVFLGAAAFFFLIGMFEVGHAHSSLKELFMDPHSHLEGIHSPHGSDGSTSLLHWIFMGIGGFALAAGHYLNHRLCASCKCCKA